MKKQTKAKVAVGTTVGAILAAAGAVLFFTKTKVGKQTVKKVKAEAADLGKEVAHKVTSAKNLSKQKYHEIVDEIVDEYAKKKKVATKTVIDLKKDLKDHWTDVQKEVKNVTKKASKKIVKKTTPKKTKKK